MPHHMIKTRTLPSDVGGKKMAIKGGRLNVESWSHVTGQACVVNLQFKVSLKLCIRNYFGLKF